MKKILSVILVLSLVGALFTGIFPIGVSADDEPYYEAFVSTKLTGFLAWGEIAKTATMPLGVTFGNGGSITNSASGVLTLSPKKATSGNVFTSISPLEGEEVPTTTTSLAGNPFTVDETKSADLSAYDGLRFQVNSKSITAQMVLTIGAVGTDHDFKASVKFKYADREANNNIYLFFDIPETEEEKSAYKYFVNTEDSSVGITDEQLKEINYFAIDLGRTTVGTGFITMSDLACFSKEGGVSYSKIMADAATKRWAEYTSMSWKEFKGVYDLAKAATSTSQREKYAVLLQEAMEKLVPLTISSKKLPGFDNWTTEDLAKAYVGNGTMELINDAETLEKFAGPNTKQAVKVTGKTADSSVIFQNFRPNTTSFTRMPSDIFGAISHTGYTGIRFYVSSLDYTKFARYESQTKTTTGFKITVGGNEKITTACEQVITIDGAGKGDEFVLTFDGPGYIYIPFSALSGEKKMPNPGYMFRLEIVLPSAGATIYLSDFEYYKKETNDNAVQLSELAQLIGQAQDVDEFEYSDATLKVLEKALNAAQAVFNSSKAMEEDVAKAAKDLRAAINGLKKGEVKYVNLNSFHNWQNIEETPGITVENAVVTLCDERAFIAPEAEYGIKFKLNRGKTNFAFSSFNENAVYNNPFGPEYKYISGIRMYVAIEKEEYARGKYLQLSLTNVNYTWESEPINSTKAYDGPGWYYWPVSSMELAEKYAELKVATASLEEQLENERAIMSGSHEMIPAPDAFTLAVNVSGSTSIYISELQAYQKIGADGKPEGMKDTPPTGDNGRNMVVPFIFMIIALCSASALMAMKQTKKSK